MTKLIEKGAKKNYILIQVNAAQLKIQYIIKDSSGIPCLFREGQIY